MSLKSVDDSSIAGIEIRTEGLIGIGERRDGGDHVMRSHASLVVGCDSTIVQTSKLENQHVPCPSSVLLDRQLIHGGPGSAHIDT